MSQHFRDIILRSMSRTLWVDAYASEVEERNANGDMTLRAASHGEDWMDVAPETPEAARAMALELCARIEKLNSRTVEDGFIVALVADGMRLARGQSLDAFEQDDGSDDLSDHLADQFGHYLVMEALGHGVAWTDDHEEQPLQLPSCENFTLRDEVPQPEASHA